MAELRPCPNPECRNTMIHMGRASLPYDDGETETAVLKHQAMCCTDDGCGVQGPLRDTETEAIAAWNALPREERWVPVSEGLPADRTEVDVYQKTPLREAGHFIRKIRVGLLYESQTFRTPGGRYQVVPFITHWRPHTPPRGPEATRD